MLALSGDVVKLAVALGTAAAGEVFAVAAQGNAQLLKQSTYSIGADGQPITAQCVSDLTQAPVRARTAPSHRVPRQ